MVCALAENGLRVVMWFTRCHEHLLRPALRELFTTEFAENSVLRCFDQDVNQYIEKARIVPLQLKWDKPLARLS